MHFINWIKVPFPEAVNTFNLSDNFLYSVSLTGFYQAIPYADDDFEKYATGIRSFFSGSGNWMGSGFSIQSPAQFNYYFYDGFENYATGTTSGFFNSGYLNSGLFLFFNPTSGFIEI